MKVLVFNDKGVVVTVEKTDFMTKYRQGLTAPLPYRPATGTGSYFEDFLEARVAANVWITMEKYSLLKRVEELNKSYSYV
jgi:hypothetical protein